MIIEVAVDEFEHARRAQELGADRIELCANLNEGGTTPSAGLMQMACQQLDVPIHVMIRCRPGNFHYSEDEINIMKHDIKVAAQAGAKGVVFGVLDKLHRLDLETNRMLIKLAKDHRLQATFHRAFDVCTNPARGFDKIITLGFDHILTSGQAIDAEKGVSYIEKMVRMSNGKVNIIAGKGVNMHNALLLMKTNINAIHFTCRRPGIDSSNQAIEGSEYIFDDKKINAIVAERSHYEKHLANKVQQSKINR